MDKKLARIRRGARLRYNLRKLGAVRLVVHRTSRHIYAQIISPDTSKVLVAASTVERVIRENLKFTGNKYAAGVVGQIIAERALNKDISKISFDRSGYKYHGRVQALAESARKFGINF
ncbi:50S ribosomal protein L18 [Blochmannia endosymbiont of Polyrhachis (Hedomyrma) turneri]|uniref:50S ribosomal protein L18 n=1 Tax=Blochmannia endosymbiont of Polyrhachis (Hedomyrma) turneri TaxID=1505596 RepID=UPI00061A6911|nr:50S ribosomal protein L18 [Blochmannia endosymbiont of Polyrhachis (Hedomyrma) turneri]AKC59785.1 50S ribosomal protein L18 [Blochmannia endosymbiont of Polyrhachis (Hedomyrma) turneri]